PLAHAPSGAGNLGRRAPPAHTARRWLPGKKARGMAYRPAGTDCVQAASRRVSGRATAHSVFFVVRRRCRGRQQRLQLFRCQLTKVTAPQGPLHGERPEVRPLHAAYERALALKQLARFLAAGTTSNERVPTIGGLAAGGLTRGHFNPFPAVERSL